MPLPKRSAGWMPTHSQFNDITGDRFGRLVVRGYSHSRGKQHFWLCRCDCGASKRFNGCNLKTKKSKSCGCLRDELASERNTTHGEYVGGISDEMRIWNSMISRCDNQSSSSYRHYGQRGITVCDRWRNSFDLFLEDMGRRPSKRHSIDRIDNNGNYEPGNCRWATRKQQNRNRRNVELFEMDGCKKSLTEWCELYGARYGTVWARIRDLGWSLEESLTRPSRQASTSAR